MILLRSRGLAAAQNYKLKKTVAAIENRDNCYEAIFKIALKECRSRKKLVRVILSSWSPEIAYNALCVIKNFTERQRNSLLKLCVVDKGFWPAHYYALCSFNWLSLKQRNLLIKKLITNKDAILAESALTDFSWLNKKQRNKLIKIAFPAN